MVCGDRGVFGELDVWAVRSGVELYRQRAAGWLMDFGRELEPILVDEDQ